jgi:hypothetical protein
LYELLSWTTSPGSFRPGPTKTKFCATLLTFVVYFALTKFTYAVRIWGPPMPLYHIKPDNGLDDIKSKVEVSRIVALKAVNEIPKNTLLSYFQHYLGFTSNNIEGNSLTQEEVGSLLNTDTSASSTFAAVC